MYALVFMDTHVCSVKRHYRSIGGVSHSDKASQLHLNAFPQLGYGFSGGHIPNAWDVPVECSKDNSMASNMEVWCFTNYCGYHTVVPTILLD